MNKPGRITTATVGAAALVLAAAGPALATTIRIQDPYSGAVRANNLGNITLAGNSASPVISTCTSGQLDATVNSNGTGGQFTSVSITGCTNNRGGTTTVTALNLPYSGMQVDYAPVVGGRDGKLTVFAPSTTVDLRLVMSLPAWGIPSLTCDYGLLGTTPITMDLFNPANPNKPVPSNTHAQGRLTAQSLQRIGSSTLCPPSTAISARFQLLAMPSGSDLILDP
ncbi:hypothetical protein [Actinomadura macrotermitis]|uniref:Secreted protein n=1 Tax=Actinomadura macrotermitis TaxID=2585200 RepID=A0A7K0C0Y7_9ACTN|nr:hypothetical protein [Actinomadura macrotermitis]MQY07016.1 hypothetical protein [Actinomadura macrotermitis]